MMANLSLSLSNSEKAIIENVENGLLFIVKDILDESVDLINTLTDGGDNLLLLALRHGHSELAVLLIEKGVKIHFVNNNPPKDTNLNKFTSNRNPLPNILFVGKSPLDLACMMGFADVARLILLIDRRSGKIFTAEDRNRLVAYAETCGHAEVVEVLYENVLIRDYVGHHGNNSLLAVSGIEEAISLIESGIDMYACDKDGDNIFMYALRHGHSEVAKILLDIGVERDYVNKSGQSPLMYALRYGDVEIAEILIDSGLDINAKDKAGDNALMYSIRYGHVETVQMLLQLGCEIDVTNSNGYTPLMLALRYGILHIAVFFIECGSLDLNLLDKNGDSAFMYALRHGREEALGMLIDRRVNRNVVNKQGHTPLMYALCYGNNKLAEQLVREGSDINVFDELGDSALMYALRRGHIEIVQLLLDRGAKRDFANQHGHTPLMYSLLYGNALAAESILSSGVDIDLLDENGDSALMYALVYGNTKIAKLLLDKRVNFNVANQHGHSPLMYAILYGNIPIAEMLIEKGADINAKDLDGDNALMYALREGHSKMAKLLVDKRIETNFINQHGHSPLMYAILYDNVLLAAVLVVTGVDVNIKDREGDNSLMFALRSGHTEVAELLIDKGVKLDVVNNAGRNPLMYAFLYGNFKVVEILLRRNCDISLRDKNGDNALMYAMRFRQSHKSDDHLDKLIRQLLEKGIDISKKNKFGKSPVIQAMKDGYISIVKLFLERGLDVREATALAKEFSSASIQALLEARKEYIDALQELILQFCDLAKSAVEGNGHLEYALRLLDLYQTKWSDVSHLIIKESNINVEMLGPNLGKLLGPFVESPLVCLNELSDCASYIDHLTMALEALKSFPETVRKLATEELKVHEQRLGHLLLYDFRIPALPLIIPDYDTGDNDNNNLTGNNLYECDFRLFFLCPYTLDIIPCGEEFMGYLFQRSKSWYIQAAPVLRIGLAIGKLTKLSAMKLKGNNAGLLNFLSRIDKSVAMLDTIEGKPSPDPNSELEDCLLHIDINFQNVMSAYDAIRTLLLDIDPELQYLRMRKVTADKNRFSWIIDSEEAQDDFKRYTSSLSSTMSPGNKTRAASAIKRNTTDNLRYHERLKDAYISSLENYLKDGCPTCCQEDYRWFLSQYQSGAFDRHIGCYGVLANQKIQSGFFATLKEAVNFVESTEDNGIIILVGPQEDYIRMRTSSATIKKSMIGVINGVTSSIGTCQMKLTLDAHLFSMTDPAAIIDTGSDITTITLPSSMIGHIIRSPGVLLFDTVIKLADGSLTHGILCKQINYQPLRICIGNEPHMSIESILLSVSKGKSNYVRGPPEHFEVPRDCYCESLIGLDVISRLNLQLATTIDNKSGYNRSTGDGEEVVLRITSRESLVPPSAPLSVLTQALPSYSHDPSLVSFGSWEWRFDGDNNECHKINYSRHNNA